MNRNMAASLVLCHDFNFRVTAGVGFHAERQIMIVGDNPIGERIELEVRVQHSYYVDATYRTMHHLSPQVPLVGSHCRLARLEYYGPNSYVYFECQESDGTTCMFVAKIEGWLME